MALLEKTGLKTFVGKVNMDRNGPDTLQEADAETSAADTIRWLDSCIGKYQNVRPILTPRFIPSCSDELMKKLAEIRKRYKLPVQSHLSENPGEVSWYRSFAPKADFTGTLTAGLIFLAEKTALPLWPTVFIVRTKKYSL